MKKDTCESQQRITISFLKSHNYFSKNLTTKGTIHWSYRGDETDSARIIVNEENNQLICSYTLTTLKTGESRNVVNRIEITSTPCYFGGKRYWFICPHCSKRYAVLYLKEGSMACRTSQGLAYESQQRTHTGYAGLISKTLGKLWDAEEKNDRVRVKYWKGKPTKRYQCFLNLCQGVNSHTSQTREDLLNQALAKKSFRK